MTRGEATILAGMTIQKKGEIVSFYEWAVKMAEKEVDSNEP